MMGFEMPLPVVSCAMPGWWAMASMMLVADVARSSCGRTRLMGAVECFSLVSPVTPVTTSSFSCRWRKNTSVESSA